MISSPSGVLRVRNVDFPPHSMKCGGVILPPNEWVAVDWAFLERFGSAKWLQVDFSSAADALRTHDEQGRLTFDFWIPLSMVDGYGRHALAIYSSLRDLGVQPVLRDVAWIDHKYLTREIEREAEANIQRPPTRIGVCMSVPYDTHMIQHSSVHKLAITQFETDRIPEYHIKQVNQTDHLITTSHFQPEIWRRSGLRQDLPITVLRPGVDTEFFAYQPRPRDGQFKVLILGALTGRKDPLAAISVFQQASEGDPSWRLTIKTRRAADLEQVLRALSIHYPEGLNDNGDIVPHIPHPFEATSPADPRIQIVISDDPPDGVRDWYHSHDCLLWPSKGEGVGLPPLEAMSCGLEVVISDNSGMSDYAFDGHCWPIRTSHLEPADGPGGFSRKYVEAFGSVGNWWVPDHAHAVEQLSRAHRAWKSGKGKGSLAAEYVRQHHTLEMQARSVLDVIEQYV